MNKKNIVFGALASAFLALSTGTLTYGEELPVPSENITVAEAITTASKMSAEYYGEAIPEKSGEWYNKYVSYAVSKGIISENEFDDLDRFAKRYELAELIGKALPSDVFMPINNIEDIPDVSEAKSYRDRLMMLYNAGIVTGTDSYGNFMPENNITREEASAISKRVAFPEKRIKTKLDIISDDDAYPMCLTNSYGASKEGITSGWLLDNRASTPRTGLYNGYGSIIDVSRETGSAYIREFNKTSTGTLLVQTRLSVGGGDGVYLEFRNDKDMSVMRTEIKDGDWKLLQKDGSYVTVYDIAENERSFAFEAYVDLDNNRVTLYINYTLCGTYDLATDGEDTNILNFRFATTNEGTPYLAPGALHIHGNYAVIEKLSFNSGSNLPTSWTGVDAYDSGDILHIDKDGYAEKHFTPVSGIVTAETMFILPESEEISFAIKSGNKNVAQFTSMGNDFYVNGTKVYENYYANLWYKLRFEANTDTFKVTVKLNGKKLAELDFAEKSTSVDNIYFTNVSDTPAQFDDIKVFRTFERDDYVPVPVVPKGEEKYIVGMNVCSLWQNENHFGWHCITPYDDPQPVLGYYDEGLAETADWELKYIIEHGIDFQAFCIYANSTNSPQRYGATHLYDGFMNAKYSDMSKFCVIWETANAQSPSSFEAWKDYYVPYFIEYYFKDPRHIVIDNKPLLLVFGANKIPDRLGGTNADVKVLFDYLEEEVRKLGFDGMIYLACGSSSKALAEMGFDGCYAYNWGNSGYLYTTNINSITSSANAGHVYTVPTISVGFNSIPWHGIRYPLMSEEDFADAQKWVKEEYLTKYPTEKWQENFVMLSTWNEYGEGTYMMPSTDEKGFRYLDGIREAYTDEKKDASINTVPTEEQKYRINRLYPQYRRLLRKEGYYEETISESELINEYTVDYSTRQNVTVWSVTNPVKNQNGISGITGNDAIITINDLGTYMPLSQVAAIRVKAKFPKGTRMQIFFTTSEDTSWTEGKSVTVISDSDEMKEYTVFMNNHPYWKGRLVGLRIDPVSTSGHPFVLKSATFCSAPAKPPKEMTINGQKFSINFRHETEENGDILVAFDPSVGLDFRLHCFHEWLKDKGELKLNFTKNVIVFNVGSDKYTVNGTEKSLGYKIRTIDGLPLVPINIICDVNGYTCGTNDNETVWVETDQKPYFESITARIPGQWEFNLPGDTENWSSSHMSLLVNDGYMACESTSTHNDPIIALNDDNFSLTADKYKSVELRVRYKYTQKYNDSISLYFITNNDVKWNEAKSLKVKLGSRDSKGLWETYTINLKAYSAWQDTITSIRFDPFNTYGYMDVDYIRFIEDETYVEDVPFAIINGDAEDTSNVTFEGTSIVTDPDNRFNHCFLALGNQGTSGREEWIYSVHKVNYTPGATYKAEFDVKLASYGPSMTLDKNFSAYICSNARYSDPDRATNDHVVMSKAIKASDGWVHFSYSFTVNPNSGVRNDDMFSIYSNPINKKGVGYYFDNVKVEEILPE